MNDLTEDQCVDLYSALIKFRTVKLIVDEIKSVDPVIEEEKNKLTNLLNSSISQIKKSLDC